MLQDCSFWVRIFPAKFGNQKFQHQEEFTFRGKISDFLNLCMINFWGWEASGFDLFLKTSLNKPWVQIHDWVLLRSKNTSKGREVDLYVPIYL